MLRRVTQTWGISMYVCVLECNVMGLVSYFFYSFITRVRFGDAPPPVQVVQAACLLDRQGRWDSGLYAGVVVSGTATSLLASDE